MSDVLNIQDTQALWENAWPEALKIWSAYVKLRPPICCTNPEEAMNAGIQGSFAMIRLSDHRIVIDLMKVVELGLQKDALQILAHEIGHHIYTPGNLKDNAVIISKMRWALIGLEDQAPMAANLYEDLLINDRLQRGKSLDMAGVYKKINVGITSSKLWLLYMRSYEYLWKLKRGELANNLALHTDEIDADASIIASIIRSYSKNWMDGALRFGAMLYPYLLEEKDAAAAKKSVSILMDTEQAGKNGGMISGLTELDGELADGLIDPRMEARNKKGTIDRDVRTLEANLQGGSGPEQRYLNPGVYVDLMQQVNPDIDKQELVSSYYKEIALPYLIDFPVETNRTSSNTLPEGVETWDIGDDIDEIDWIQTAIGSAAIFPGINTVKRIYGASGDVDLNESALDVYIGVDCSGSMVNPSLQFSWPVLAATIIALSALRAGSKVMGCLSGEPGSYLENERYETDERKILTVLTSYLGTGYAFGIGRFKEPFAQKLEKKSHVIMVTDDDLFAMLAAEVENGDDHWEIIEATLKNAGGSGTLVLHSKNEWHADEVLRLKTMGWQIHYVTNLEELLKFASDFTQINY